MHGLKIRKVCIDDNDCKYLLWIGFKDKNGEDIYEGDILQASGSEYQLIVESMDSFLINCGKYEAQNGVEIFPSLTIVGHKYEFKADDCLSEPYIYITSKERNQ